jgi:hypothetical protein
LFKSFFRQAQTPGKIIFFAVRAALLAAVLYALRASVFSGGKIELKSLCYFTIQSNLLVAASLALSLLPFDSGAKTKLAGFALPAITLTCLVYNLALYQIWRDFGGAGYSLARTITHVVSPLGFIFVWAAFEKHGSFRWKDVFIWAAYPLAYGAVSAAVSLKYGASLYFFTDPAKGARGLLKWLGLLAAGVMLICLIFIAVDKKLSKSGKKRA